MSTSDLYNAKEKALVRDILLKEQSNTCALTGLPLDKTHSVLDHGHDDDMFVRGVISRQSNSMLGVIENGWSRYMKWWYKGTVSDFLRQCAQYLERKPDFRYRHDQWLSKCSTMFNSLNEQGKKDTLEKLGQPTGSNATERKTLFRKALLTRKFSYNTVKDLIHQKKGIK